ncbi:MAG: hypothetical protein AVDCRST_MAG33-2397 [uncultured Thermomicrobiales bacterium]|uniref:Uncharacterized protein n=1 Tax=uncultured Thermomicrobiales bacterium TaxID=1645740 RepID=A0A6J4VA66_9BACT|nr:MAG: hypothetical protein AVDCRST_MAG33-2397 [uncultured Thermomicrobiales bacterium]
MRRDRTTGTALRADRTLRATVTLALILALLLVTSPSALAQTVLSDRHAEVIAQGVGEVPDGEVVWRVTRGEALPEGDAQPAERATGFVFVPEGRAMVADMGTGQRAMLADAEAVFQAAATEQLRQSAGDDPVPYLTVDLVPIDDIDDRLADDQLLMNAGQFTSPGGERDVNLVRDVLGEDELGELPGSDLPTFVYVTDGSLTVEDGSGDETDLETQAGTMFSGELTLLAGPEGATYLAAVIGDEVATVDGVSSGSSGTASTGGTTRPDRSAPPSASAEPAGETGMLRMTFFHCGELVAPGAGPDECQPVSMLADDPLDPRGFAMASFSVLDVENGTSVPVTGAPGRDGATFIWAAMPASDYELVLDEGGLITVLLTLTVSYGGDVPEGRPGNFSVMPGGSTDVEIRARVPGLVDPDAQASPGVPSGSPVPSDLSPSPSGSPLSQPSPVTGPSVAPEVPIEALPPVFQPSLDPVIIPVIIEPPVVEPQAWT